MKVQELFEEPRRQWFTYVTVPGWFIIDESKLNQPDPVKAGLIVAGPFKSENEAKNSDKNQGSFIVQMARPDVVAKNTGK